MVICGCFSQKAFSFSLCLRTFALNYFKKIKLGTVHHPLPEGEGAGGFLLGPDKIKINLIPLKGSLYSLFFFFFFLCVILTTALNC